MHRWKPNLTITRVLFYTTFAFIVAFYWGFIKQLLLICDEYTLSPMRFVDGILSINLDIAYKNVTAPLWVALHVVVILDERLFFFAVVHLFYSVILLSRIWKVQFNLLTYGWVIYFTTYSHIIYELHYSWGIFNLKWFSYCFHTTFLKRNVCLWV